MISIGISPYAFDGVRWYLILAAVAVAVIVGWAWWQAKHNNQFSYRTVTIAALVMIPSGIVFARIFHILDNLGYYSHHTSRILSFAGLSIYGAIVGAIIGLWLYSKVGKFSFGKFTDMLTPAIIVGQAIGRVGSLITGCCHGVETNLPWGIVYTNYWSAAENDIPFHPYPVYEIIILMIILMVVRWLKHRLKRPGSLFAVYLAMYSVWRLASGFLRPNNSLLFGLHEAQVIAIIMLVLTVPFLLREWCKPRIETAGNSHDKAD